MPGGANTHQAWRGKLPMRGTGSRLYIDGAITGARLVPDIVLRLAMACSVQMQRWDLMLQPSTSG